MARAIFRILVILSLFSTPATVLNAETVKFRHLLSVYSDDKGSGMKQPEGVACSEKSLLVVSDTGNGRLLRYTFQERALKTESEIKVPQLTYPLGIQINSKGEIFVLDGKKRRILRLTPAGEFKGYVDPQGLPSSPAMVPRSFKIGTNDTIYILDILGERVLELSPDGKYQKHLEFPKGRGFFSDLAIDSKGNLFLIDSTQAVVFSSVKETKTFSPLTKNLRSYLNFPTGLATDARGRIYIVDENGGGIVILGQDGSFMGRQLSMGWMDGLVYYPTQICVNEKGEVFIADRGNNRVQIFALVQ
jgi:sugar lactone lactonase YvrE